MAERKLKLEVTRSSGIGVLLVGVLALIVAMFGLASAGANSSKECKKNCAPVPVSAAVAHCGCTTTTPPPPPPSSCSCNHSTTTSTTTPTTEVSATTAVIAPTTTTSAPTTTTVPPTTTTVAPTTTTVPPTTTTSTTTSTTTTSTTTSTTTTSTTTSTTTTSTTTTTTLPTEEKNGGPVTVEGVTTPPLGGNNTPVAPEATNGVLPFTGTSALPLAGFGLVLIGAGLGMMRRKQRRVTRLRGGI